MRVAGFGFHAPDEVLVQMNKQHGISRKNILLLAPNALLPKRRRTDYVLFLSVKDFQRNLGCHTSFYDACFLVFDSPSNLSRFNIHYMDFKQGADLHLDGFVAKPLALDFDKLESRSVMRTGFDLIASCIVEVKSQRTLLNQLMTFIYTLPSATHQKPIKELICSWMVSRFTLVKLNSDLDKLNSKVPLTPKQRARINDILSSETAEIYHKAMIEGGEAEDLARKYGISAYEIKYMHAIASKK